MFSSIAQSLAPFRCDTSVRSEMYGVEGFLTDPARISGVVPNDPAALAPHLPESHVTNLSLLHLQCHIGIDTTSWAHSIHDLLEPDGIFMIRDDHPILGAMTFEPWEIKDDYLSGGGVRIYEHPGTYTDGLGEVEHVTNHEWRHSLSEVVGSLLDAGLTIETLAEIPHMDWPAFAELTPCDQGWTLPEGLPRIPLTFAVVARRSRS